MLSAASLRAPPSTHYADLILTIEHHGAGRFDDAGRIYQALHRAHPGDAVIMHLLRMLCCDLCAFDTACRFLQKALAINPRFPEAHAQPADALNGLADE